MDRLAVVVIIVGFGVAAYELVRILPSLYKSAMLWLFGDRRGY